MNLSTTSSETTGRTAKFGWGRYLAWYLSALLLLLALVALTNAVVDPHARILLVDQPGFNQAKLTLQTNNRTGKANALRQCRYDNIILGSSRAETGIAVSHPAFSAGRTYNAALKAVSMYEMRRMAEHAMHAYLPQNILLSLDFYAFSAATITDHDFADSPLAEGFQLPSMFRYLISIRTIRESWYVVKWNRLSNIEICTDNGEHKRSYELDAARPAFDFILGRYAQGQYRRYAPSEAHFRHLQSLLKQASEAGVNVYGVVSPIHAEQLELINEMGLRAEYESWLRRLTQAFAEAQRNKSSGWRTSLWDFSGYSMVTTETVPPADQAGDAKFMHWYTDPSHFSQEIGGFMLNRVFDVRMAENMAPGPFGVRLTPDNIDTLIDARRIESERYRRDNPDVVERLQDLLRASQN